MMTTFLFFFLFTFAFFAAQVNDDDELTLIDFPQMVSTSHANAQELFDRDVECVLRFACFCHLATANAACCACQLHLCMRCDVLCLQSLCAIAYKHQVPFLQGQQSYGVTCCISWQTLAVSSAYMAAL